MIFIQKVNLLHCLLQLFNNTMPQRKAWTPQEDKTLKHLKQELKINKWSVIAKKMGQEYDMPGRTGKQCRERYHNHLDSSILRTQWTKEQQQKIYSLHDQIGNKWAIIAQKLPGRTDNCVKNHFYSRMRKAIRKLNKTIHNQFKKQCKQIKMPVLYKIVQATDQKFKNNSGVQDEIIQRCSRIKNILLSYSTDDNPQLDNDYEKLRQVANDIHDFSLKYRKKQTKVRRNSAQGDDLLMVPRFEHKGRTTSDRGDNQQEQFSMAYSRSYNEEESSYQMEDQSIPPPPKNKTTKSDQKKQKLMQVPIINKQKVNDNLIKPPAITMIVPSILSKISLNMEESTDKVEQLLKNQGILQKTQQKQRIIQRGSTIRREDSYGFSMIDEQGKHYNNMLSQSVDRVDRLKVHSNFHCSVDLDQQNKLFTSN